MIPINNSDLAWLIVSDHNQDNNLPYEELRNDILNPETDQWIYDHYGISMGNYQPSVGGLSFSDVGSTYCVALVTFCLEIGIFNGAYVGDEQSQSLQVGGNYDTNAIHTY
jgi:hypothetical protein